MKKKDAGTFILESLKIISTYLSSSTFIHGDMWFSFGKSFTSRKKNNIFYKIH